ncbi:hypothetical protein ONZ45_g5860 [Pleurotus djamor]|nr:hypothetical protein ONZ45_g5860 [Pleurotus djamor]
MFETIPVITNDGRFFILHILQVGDLIGSVNCQTGFSLGNTDQENLDYNIYATIVGTCAWDPNGCPISGQNYIDFYYGTLSLINTGSWPNDVGVVTGFWNPIISWAATGTTIPYTNFNDWLHFSSFPPAPTTITYQPPPTYTAIPWNPNPVPSSGATSQTFVRSETTVVIAIPTVTVTVTVAGATITIAPGGTPVNGMVPIDVTQPGAITPTFNYNPVPPATASSVTFTSGTWTSIVAAPTSTDESVTVDGPPDDGDDDDSNDSWILALGLLGLFFLGSIPSSVSVIGAATPAPTPPPDWPDPTDWTPPPPPPGSGNPDPDPGDDDDDDDDDDDPPEVCFTLPPFTLPYDGGLDEEDLRRRLDLGNYKNVTARSNELVKRALRPTLIWVLHFGSHLIHPPGPHPPNANTIIQTTFGATHTPNDGKVKEHVFEFQFIKDFINNQFDTSQPGVCQWLETNMWEAIQPNGQATKVAIYNAIDHTANCVWVDRVINNAKSYVTNNQKGSPNDPPLSGHISALDNLVPTQQGNQIEMMIRAFDFHHNSNSLLITATRIRDLLANITPTTPAYPPMDERFINYFATLMGQYSHRITSRGVNMLAFYRNRMNVILQDAIANTPPGSPLPTVPQCRAVYHNAAIQGSLQGGGVNGQNLAPAGIVHRPCNAAGQSGSVILFYDQNSGQPVYYAGNPVTQIYALGGTYFSLWRPNENSIYYEIDLGQTAYGTTGICDGIRYIARASTVGTPAPGVRLAHFDQDCMGGVGPGLSNLHIVDNNGNRMICLLNNFNDINNRFAIDCGHSQASIQACIAHMNVMDGFTTGFASTPFLRFQG